MKRLVTLLVTLTAFIGVVSAQEEDDVAKVMTITLTNGATEEYEVNRLGNLTFGDSQWVSLGYCLYGEDLVGSSIYPLNGHEGDYCCDYYVEVQENSEQPGLYRLVNPYGPDVYPLTEYGTYDTEKDYYMEVNATNPEEVYIEYQDTGMTWRGNFGRFYVYSFAMYYYDRGYDWNDVKEAGYFGTLKDGVITFPESSLTCQFPSYNYGFFYGNSNNNFKIDLTDTSNTGGSKSVKSLGADGSEATISLENLTTAEDMTEMKKLTM